MTSTKDKSLRLARPSSAIPGLAALLVLAGCSGGGSDGTTTPGTSGDFLVLRTEPANNGQLFLNESISIDFSNPVDLSSADLNTVAFQVFDLNGVALTEQPQGRFEIDTVPGDEVDNRRLKFSPRFPTNNTFDDGGFRPGRRYVVNLVAGINATTLNDATNSRRPLKAPASFQFTTADGTTPFELFRDTKSGGPRRAGFSVSQLQAGVAPLSLLGSAAVEIRLDFDQPLNPSTTNVPSNLDPDPTRRAGQDRGRIFLEYDDGPDLDLWIPATVELERNVLDGATVVLRPIGVLPNNAQIRVVVQSTVEDMSGESNISDTAYNEVFATFSTEQAFEPQYDAIVEKFADARNTVDFDAPLLEPQAEVRSGELRSTFDFDGQPSTLDYAPSARETILDTNFTQVAPIGSEPINVAGGVFRFREVTIPPGFEVKGVGPNPMVWLTTGDFRVDGTLSVNGGTGDRVNVLNAANFPTPGGIGVCGGGNGGRGSPNGGGRSERAEAGFGAGQRPGAGGFPGEYYCGGGPANCTGAGGGGGSFATQGDPEFNNQNSNYQQWRGQGGVACAAVSGAPPGERPFVDSRDDNDFWGGAVNVFAGLRVRGELFTPQGGNGGGGGGDRATNCNPNDPNFANDQKGGGGGAGGGVLIIQTLGKIVIGPQGLISANGGNGGGGEQAGANNAGGGGAGGSGGMVILMAAGGVEIERHGNTYESGDNNFAISADGGIGEQGEFRSQQILDKYRGFIASRNENSATGGFGGMGIVQIFVPPGDDSADNTGSFLDDNIRFLSNGGDVSRADKIALLSWRGWPDETGARRDDLGNPITVAGDGDIRPAPVLSSIPFSALSRAQSRWLDLGAVARRAGISGPNRVNTSPLPQPDFEFDGAVAGGTEDGYIDWEPSTGVRTIPVVVGDTGFSDVQTGSSFRGEDAYRIRVASAALDSQPDNRYAHYRAEFVNSFGSAVGDFRIVGHNRIGGSGDSFVFLDPSSTFPSDATTVRIIAKFFDVTTDGQVGLGPYNAVAGQPRGNVRIGFAFHVDPAGNNPNQRYPQQGFSADVTGLLQQMAANGDRPTFVKWDVLFNQRYGDNSRIVPNMPTQTLDNLVLPFRF